MMSYRDIELTGSCKNYYVSHSENKLLPIHYEIWSVLLLNDLLISDSRYELAIEVVLNRP